MAPPRKKVDIDLLKTLAGIGCTVEEMASAVKVSKDTLERRYAAVINEGKNNGKMSLRREMYKSAQRGNVAMQIWLSKNWLGMRDRIEHSSDPEAPSKLVIDLSGMESDGQKKS